MSTFIILVTLAAPSQAPGGAPAGAVVISEARPLACVVPDAYPIVEAVVAPPENVVDVRVFFRTVEPATTPAPRPRPSSAGPTSTSGEAVARLDGQRVERDPFAGGPSDAVGLPPQVDASGWYRVRLTQEGERWTGALPRPSSRLVRFIYYIEAYDANAGAVRSEQRLVRLEPKACPPAEATPSLAKASVMVQIPAMDAAPVPEGFSTKGVASSGASRVGVLGTKERTSLFISLGVGAAAAAVGLATYKPDEPQSQVELLGSEPGPGGTISLAAPRLSLRLRLEGPENVGPGSVLVHLRRNFLTCVTMKVPHGGLTAHVPVEISVDQVTSVGCAAPFTVTQGRVEVRGPGEQPEFGRELPMTYTFVP